MPYPYPIVTRVDGELIDAVKYNADQQAHVDNNIPPSINDYSATATEMRLKTDPGEAGSESLPTTLAGELERLRFILSELKGGYTHWYVSTSSPSFVSGLNGLNNAATPLTKYDVSAPMLVARSLTRGLIVDGLGTVLTNDITVAGPAANGRDQAGAFSANSWVHLYYITDGVNRATLSSTVSPLTLAGPTLPTGYTHWAYLCSLRLNASTQFLRTRVCGAWVFYDIDDNGATRVLSNGVATTLTAIDLSALVSPVSLACQIKAALVVVHNTANITFSLFTRPGGATWMTTGQITALVVTPAVSVGAGMVNTFVQSVPAGSPSLDYKLNAAPVGSGGANFEVMGYRVPNGGE